MTGKVSKDFSRRAVLGGLVAGIGAPALAGAPTASILPVARSPGPPPPAVPDLSALIARADLGGKLGFVLADADTGRMLENMNPILGQPPASVTKAMTAQYALDVMGPAHAFSTRLIGTGPLKNGRLNGDLILVGGGDPTLDSTALAEMAAALKAAGIRDVAGRFLVHGGKLPHIGRIDPNQPDHLGYNPAVSGLNLNYNRVHFEWRKQGETYRIMMDARTHDYRPEITMAHMKVVDRKGPIYTYSNGGRTDNWTVAKAALGVEGSRWLPVRQPELYAGEVFQIFARSQGIQLGNAILADGPIHGRVLVDRKSPPLARILKGMLAYSNNLTAEVSGLSASLNRGKGIAELQESAHEMSSWMRSRLGARKPRFIDHSGLGDRSRVSALDMVQALVHIGPHSSLSSILKPIPIHRPDGTIDDRTRAEIVAKTGTLNFVSALAGYIRTETDKNLAFAIFSADVPRRQTLRPQDRERPVGGKGWTRRARSLQWALIGRWLDLYG